MIVTCTIVKANMIFRETVKPFSLISKHKFIITDFSHNIYTQKH